MLPAGALLRQRIADQALAPPRDLADEPGGEPSQPLGRVIVGLGVAHLHHHHTLALPTLTDPTVRSIVGSTNVDTPNELEQLVSTTPTLSTQIIGQTEKAMGAILDRLLAETGLSEPQWVTLAVAAGTGAAVDRDQFIRRVAGVFKISYAEAQARVAELTGAGLLDTDGSQLTPSPAGQQLFERIRAATNEITERLWGDLSPDDLATTARVLSTVLARANSELSG